MARFWADGLDECCGFKKGTIFPISFVSSDLPLLGLLGLVAMRSVPPHATALRVTSKWQMRTDNEIGKIVLTYCDPI